MLTKREPNTPLDVLDQDFPPQTLICRDCRQAFEFTVEEQRFFLSKGYWRPISCPACRQLKRDASKHVRVSRNELETPSPKMVELAPQPKKA